jgi:hypothetical protein
MSAPLSIVHSRTHEFTDIAESLLRSRRNSNIVAGAKPTSTSGWAPQGVETHM